MLFDNHKFTSYIATYRFLLNFAPKPAAPEVLDFFKGRCEGRGQGPGQPTWPTGSSWSAIT